MNPNAIVGTRYAVPHSFVCGIIHVTDIASPVLIISEFHESWSFTIILRSIYVRVKNHHISFLFQFVYDVCLVWTS